MIIIERKREQVSVAGRTFELSEMTGQELSRYIRDQVDAQERIALDLGGRERFISAEATEVFLHGLTPLFVRLLEHPTDGDPPPCREWVQENVSHRMRLELLQHQDRLNCLEDLLGKAGGLWHRGRAMLQAGQG